MPKLLIATPTTRNLVNAAFAFDLARLSLHTERAGIPVEVLHFDLCDLPVQRDYLAREFMRERSFTHLLFIDSDMSFPPGAALRLLGYGVPFVGAICSLRGLDFTVMEKALAAGRPLKEAYAAAHQFKVVPLPSGQVPFKGPLAELWGIGMAFTLLARDCFDKIAPTLTPYPAPFLPTAPRTLLPFFRKIEELQEDLSFCKRWQDAGGKVFGDATGDVLHQGNMDYGVAYSAHLRARTTIESAA